MGKFQWFPDQASTLAPQVDLLFFYLCGVTVVFTVLIAVLVGYFAIKYRRQHEDERPAEVHPSKWLEASWIVIPLILTMVMFAWGAVIFVNYSRPPADAMEINVIGKQWMWKVQHPDGQREINQLHVPVGKPVKLIMTSQDVIHDFGIPAFRVKMDVLPGRYTTEWFEATKVGEYHLFCDQYCGTEHSRMVGSVVVMEPGDYQKWLTGQIPDVTPAQAGAILFKEHDCFACHSQYAPTLANVYMSKVDVWEDGKKSTVVADENYIYDSIVHPSKQIVDGYENGKQAMPNFGEILSTEEVSQLVAYLKTLNGKGDIAPDPFRMRNAYPAAKAVDPQLNGNKK
jgi:cytochrome c oxidase subunit 2